MEKSIVTMTNWVIVKSTKPEEELYNLSGIADKHPKLGNNVYVAHTSTYQGGHMVNDEEYGKTFMYETLNTIYKCPIKYMDEKPFTSTDEWYEQERKSLIQPTEINSIINAEIEISIGKELSKTTKALLNIIKDGQKEIKEAEERHIQELLDIITENNWERCAYIEVSKISTGDILAYKIDTEDGPKMGTIKPYVHSGMFTDSVLYLNDEEEVDFRYFPHSRCIETYNWSENLERVYIKNEKGDTIRFNNDEIKPGEVRCFENERVKSKEEKEDKEIIDNGDER